MRPAPSLPSTWPRCGHHRSHRQHRRRLHRPADRQHRRRLRRPTPPAASPPSSPAANGSKRSRGCHARQVEADDPGENQPDRHQLQGRYRIAEEDYSHPSPSRPRRSRSTPRTRAPLKFAQRDGLQGETDSARRPRSRLWATGASSPCLSFRNTANPVPDRPTATMISHATALPHGRGTGRHPDRHQDECQRWNRQQDARHQ